LNGIINVYKEKGYTSHDVVARLRGILKTKKIGHTGTLDPDAVGVLPVCVGNATKVADILTDRDK
jgi:tRNA pseudouridine55 synthase